MVFTFRVTEAQKPASYEESEQIDAYEMQTTIQKQKTRAVFKLHFNSATIEEKIGKQKQEHNPEKSIKLI